MNYTERLQGLLDYFGNHVKVIGNEIDSLSEINTQIAKTKEAIDDCVLSPESKQKLNALLNEWSMLLRKRTKVEINIDTLIGRLETRLYENN